MKSRVLIGVLVCLSVTGIFASEMEENVEAITACVRRVLLRSPPEDDFRGPCPVGKVLDGRSCVSEIIECNQDPSESKCPNKYRMYDAERCVHRYSKLVHERIEYEEAGQAGFIRRDGTRNRLACPRGQTRSAFDGSCESRFSARSSSHYGGY